MRIVADAGLTRGVQMAELRGFYKMTKSNGTVAEPSFLRDATAR
jgi:hypothetical protein